MVVSRVRMRYDPRKFLRLLTSLRKFCLPFKKFLGYARFFILYIKADLTSPLSKTSSMLIVSCYGYFADMALLTINGLIINAYFKTYNNHPSLHAEWICSPDSINVRTSIKRHSTNTFEHTYEDMGGEGGKRKNEGRRGLFFICKYWHKHYQY